MAKESSDADPRMTYWGYRFEKAFTEDDGDEPVNNFAEFCAIFTGRLGGHRLVFGAEVDGVNGEGKYVELKTNRELFDDRTRKSFEEFKLMRCWAQCFLAGIDDLRFGFRNDKGVVGRIETVAVQEIPRRLRGLVQWDPQIMLKFGEQFLNWLWTTLPTVGEGPFQLAFDPKERQIVMERGGVEFL